MKCSKARKLISSYIDNQLDELQAVDLQNHLAICSSCSDEAQALQHTVSLLGAWQDIEPQRQFHEMSARLQNETAGIRWPLLPKWVIAAFAAASIMAGVVAGLATSNTAPAENVTEKQVVTALQLHQYDDVLEASIVYASAGGENGSVKGEER